MAPLYRPQDFPAPEDESESVVLPPGPFEEVVQVFRTFPDFLRYSPHVNLWTNLHSVETRLEAEGKVGIVFISNPAIQGMIPATPRVQVFMLGETDDPKVRDAMIDDYLTRMAEVYKTPLVPLDPFAIQLLGNNEFLMAHPEEV